MKEKEIIKMCVELEEYANLEGTELGEICNLLTRLCSYICGYSAYISEECQEAIIKEIKSQLDNFKENSKIVTSEKTVTVKNKELHWKG